MPSIFHSLLKRLAICTALIFTHASAHAETVGLVLSGGGCKGIAHIGFIQALEENEIPIDYITGTSMGAIVGSLYSIGYSPAEMMELLLSEDFADWSTGTIAARDQFLYATPPKRPDWVSVNLAPADTAMIPGILPTRLINPLPMSFAFMELYAPATGAAQGDFDHLMIPFRCVASDIYRHKSVVFSRGELADAVRASMSFPLVFQPIMVGDTLLYDGGLYDVYPVDVMQTDFNPDRLIGVDVSTPNTPPGLNDLVSQVENMIMSGYLPKFPDNKGVNVVLDLSRYGLLNWGAAKEIYQTGYRRGIELADSLRSRISARRTAADVAARRAQFRKTLPTLKFDSVSVGGVGKGKHDYILSTLTGDVKVPPETLTTTEARRGFYRIASSGRRRNLVPHARYDSVSRSFSLNIDADAENDYHLGIGGYLTSSQGSMIYAGAHWNRYSFRAPDVGLEAWLGQSYMAAAASASMRLHTPFASDLRARMSISRERLFETEKMFYDFDTPAFISTTSAGGNIAWRIASGYHSVAEISVTGAHFADSYRRWEETPPGNSKEHLTTNLGAVTLSWHRSTLDDETLPTSGHSFDISASALYGRTHTSGQSENQLWEDIRASLRAYFPLSRRFTLGTEAWGHWSGKNLQSTYEASIVSARAFAPLPADMELYDPGFRANQWLAAGIIPVIKLTSVIQLRASGYVYVPMRRILPSADGGARYSGWFGSAEFTGDLSAVMSLPFATVRLYASYRTTPASHWSAGIGIGIPLRAPSLLR